MCSPACDQWVTFESTGSEATISQWDLGFHRLWSVGSSIQNTLLAWVHSIEHLIWRGPVHWQHIEPPWVHSVDDKWMLRQAMRQASAFCIAWMWNFHQLTPSARLLLDLQDILCRLAIELFRTIQLSGVAGPLDRFAGGWWQCTSYPHRNWGCKYRAQERSFHAFIHMGYLFHGVAAVSSVVPWLDLVSGVGLSIQLLLVYSLALCFWSTVSSRSVSNWSIAWWFFSSSDSKSLRYNGSFAVQICVKATFSSYHWWDKLVASPACLWCVLCVLRLIWNEKKTRNPNDSNWNAQWTSKCNVKSKRQDQDCDRAGLIWKVSKI